MTDQTSPQGIKETKDAFALCGALVSAGKGVKSGEKVSEQLNEVLSEVLNAAVGAEKIPAEVADIDKAELQECYEAFRTASNESTATDEAINTIVNGVLVAAKGTMDLINAKSTKTEA